MNDFVDKFDTFFRLHKFHYESCDAYRSISKNLFSQGQNIGNLHDLPFIPAQLFKTHQLLSVPSDQIVKIMSSSGTSGTSRSKVCLDKKTARAQSEALTNIMMDITKNKRRPLLIIDTDSQLSDRNQFSARGAGILGFSMFGSKRYFAFDTDMEIRDDQVSDFLNNSKRPKLLFGFTFIIWKEMLSKLPEGAQIFGDQEAVLIHGGGWKKLKNADISFEQFKAAVKSKLGSGITVREYYGMVEQTGSIFLGCECGFLHTNQYNELLIRDPNNLEISEPGQPGVIQVLSTLPESYPGFSILTDDIGVIDTNASNRNCEICATNTTRFTIKGRLPKAEIRGCSDTYAG